MVPISVRGAGEHGDLGNRVSSFMAPLPVFEEDPAERLRLVSATMGDLKESKQAVGATMMTQLHDFAPPTIAGQAARLQPAQRFFNLVVTNVPGPQFPLYLMGRRMESMTPMVPLARRQAVCFGIMSYDGQHQLRPDRRLRGDERSRHRWPTTSKASIAELAEAAGAGKPKRRSGAKSGGVRGAKASQRAGVE